MRLPHVTPFARAPIYFFTACTAARRPVLSCVEAEAVLSSLWTQSAERNGWFVGRFLLMPDHVHFFACPSSAAIPRADWLKLWKSLSARLLIKQLGVTAPLWQPDTFDHVLRSAESYAEKWNYVRENPVRAGLVARSDDWRWQGEIHPLAF